MKTNANTIQENVAESDAGDEETITHWARISPPGV